MRNIVMPALIAASAVIGAASVAAASPAMASQVRAVAVTVSAPAPANELFGVSCVSSKDCVAVGNDQDAYSNRGGPLVETWNGKAWKAVTVKLPAHGTAGELFGVACKSTKECVAVGLYLNTSDAGFGLAETWNGKSWAASTLPSPKGSVGVELNGVSCATAKSCVAVGTDLTTSGAQPVAESWSGGAWKPATPPDPKGSVTGTLSKVSCTSAAFCVGVGEYGTNSGGSVLADSWNGRAWTRMTAAPPASSKNDAALTGVSCTSAKNCVAVGAGTGVSGRPNGLTGFAELWNGSKWTGVKVAWPRGTANSYLTGVSCASAKSCVTAGYFDINLNAGGNTGKATAASWNGKAWAVAKVPAPARGKASLFESVSCLSAANCVAVGQVGPDKTLEGNGLSGFWNGKAWKLVTAV
jgi:hypothetical protein